MAYVSTKGLFYSLFVKLYFFYFFFKEDSLHTHRWAVPFSTQLSWHLWPSLISVQRVQRVFRYSNSGCFRSERRLVLVWHPPEIQESFYERCCGCAQNWPSPGPGFTDLQIFLFGSELLIHIHKYFKVTYLHCEIYQRKHVIGCFC